MGGIQSAFKECCIQDFDIMNGQLADHVPIKFLESFNLKECKVCLSQIHLKELAYFSKCRHYFHKKCVRQHVKHHILEDQSKIKCLEEGCGRQLQPHQIQNYSNTLLFTKYLRQEFQTYIGKNRKTTFKCLNHECQTFIQKNQNCLTYECLACNKAFCLTCNCQYHYGATCQLYQKQLSTQGNEKSQSLSNQNLKSCPHCERTFFVNGKDIISIYCKCGKRICSNCGGPDCNCFNCKQLSKETK